MTTTNTTQREADERALFEATHFKPEDFPVERSGSSYALVGHRIAWNAWLTRAAIDQSTRQAAPSGQWTIEKQDDMGIVRDAEGAHITSTYYSDAKRFVDAHNASIVPAATDQPSAGQLDERAQDGWAPMPAEAGMYWRCDPINGADFPPSIVEVVVSPGGPLCTVAHDANLGFGFKGDKFYPINAGPNMWLKIEQPSTPSHSKQPIAFSCSRRAEAGSAAWSKTCESHCGDNNLCPAASVSLTPTAPQAASPDLQNDIDMVKGALELCEPEEQQAFKRILAVKGIKHGQSFQMLQVR